jgi:predicted nucleotidyltransferase
MDMAVPYASVIAPLHGRVLGVLAGTTRQLTGREVARLAGTSQSAAQQVLHKLTEHGLLTEEEAGARAAYLYTLNREHLAVEPVLALLRLRSILFDRIRSEVEAWEVVPHHASVFGSAARGDGDTESDIDVFVVRPAEVDEENKQWRSQLDRLSERIGAWTGNHAGIATVSQRDVRRLTRERPPIVRELETDAVVLLGPSIKDMFGRKGR